MSALLPPAAPDRGQDRENSEHISHGIVSSLFDDDGPAPPLQQPPPLSAISTARHSGTFTLPGADPPLLGPCFVDSMTLQYQSVCASK